jgi:threonine dehydrogenase-like Zn-dependent dehydrogenase
MATMTAAFYDGNGTMELKDHPKPEVGPGDIILNVKATGICGSDLQMNVDKDAPDKLPVGHEVAGVIEEIGVGVDPGLLGRRVAVEIIGHGRACTTCWYCRQGQFKLCTNMAPPEGGGFAEYMKRKAIGCYPVPDSLSWEETAMVEPLAVSIHGVRRGDMKGGEVVAVLGSGTIGLTAIAAARALGAGKVFSTARYEQQASLAKKLGADDALPDDGPAFWDAIAEVTDGRGADITIETVGGHQSATMHQAVAVTRDQGRIVIIGGFRRPFEFDFLPPMLSEQSIIFSSCYAVLDGRHDYELAIEMIASGKVSVEQMVTHRYRLDQIQQGFETSYDKSTGAVKVQILQ